jgi:hypothetical protein
MLIRIRGGTGGIRQYLEEGKKEGREHTRDELDERIVLQGDLEFTDTAIQSIVADRQRYLHITLAFKEDEIPCETMREICAEFKEFALSAYRIDECCFYAEVHNPKIKSYVHSKTGDLIERKPHIHVVIPRINLLTGKDLNPFDLVERQTKWLSAVQEYINDKYGLASPKDNRRYTFTDEAEMISRIKGDLFDGSNRELREEILLTVLDRDITRYEDFKTLLAEFGAVRTRNEGRPSEYLNVKLPGATKGVNLKNAVFLREFIEKPTEEKRRILTAEIERRYETTSQPRPTSTELLTTLREWQEVRSLELKYLHTGTKFYKQTYLPADANTRRQLLTLLAADYYQEHEPDPVHLEDLDKGRPDTPSGQEGRQTAHHPSRRNPSRPRDGNDSVIGQLAADHVEGKARRQSEKLAEFAEIRRHLDARRLLNYLSKTHGLICEKYEITKEKDGGDRIRCGRRHLNVSDFLTREMCLPFAEAAPILRTCYAAQRNLVPHQAREHQPVLWENFQTWRKQRAERKTADCEYQRETEKTRRAEIKQQYQSSKGHLQDDRSIPFAKRKLELSLLRMKRIEDEKRLRETIHTEREALHEKYPARPAEVYQDFLVETVERQGVHAERALSKLRRMKTDVTVKETRDMSLIEPATLMPVAAHEVIKRALSYRVARNGDVTYQRNGRDALVDEGRAVRVLQQDQDTIEIGLRLAVLKFGDQLNVRGSDEFKRKVAEIAVRKGIRCNFSDPALQRYKAQLE